MKKLEKPAKARKRVKPAVPEDQVELPTQCELCSAKFANPTLAAWHVSEEHGDG